MALVGEGLVVAERDLLDEPRSHHSPLQFEAHRARPAFVRDAGHRPFRVRRPAVGRRCLDVACRERGAEKVAREKFEIVRNVGCGRNRRVVHPRRGVQRANDAARGFDLEGADVPDGQIEDQADVAGGNGVESFRHGDDNSLRRGLPRGGPDSCPRTRSLVTRFRAPD